eukprot:CCRYP_010306-RE/>CCRYP_010306-RE protein AED:0.19 eAED:0.19 QI:247/0.83/0.71/1/0.66/0.42/7/0/644
MSKKSKRATGSARIPQLDPILIARGMSSRYLSTKTPKISALSKDAIEKDLRHMEAYRNACIGYNQQLFVFKNQESVKTGTFGMFVPHPNGEGEALDHPTASSVPTNEDRSTVFALPSKIDPEEEKRLSVLRKKISLSEFKREQLETEYLSLRAHYVHASQLVRKTRTYEFGRWKLLREVMERRGRVLGLMRVLAAMGRDVEAAIRWRGRILESGDYVDVGMNDSSAEAASADAMKESKLTENAETAQANEKTRSLYEMWTDIESQLKEAEAACSQLETPSELLQMLTAPDTPFSQPQQAQPTHNYSTRSPTKSRNVDDDGKKGRKRSSSVTSAEESVLTSSNNNGENGKKSASTSNDIVYGLEPHVIPWDSMVEPSTPYGVPILLSCLSSATDKAVGYLTDVNDPKAITWLESSLPASTAAFDSDAIELLKLTEEVRLLEEEMNKEVMLNTELQKQIIKSRERNDQMVAMMQLLRTETEAVLERHNIIMESPEARAKAAELHKRTQEAEKLKNPSAEEEDDGDEHEEEGEEDGDVDDNEVDSEEESGEEGEIQEDEDSNEEEDGDEEEEREDVKIKEITVDEHSDVAGETDESEEGDVAEDEDMEEGEVGDEENPEEEDGKRYDEEGDEESSSMTPPNEVSFNR